MNPSSSADDGDPAKQIFLRPALSLFIVLALLTFSCNNKDTKKETPALPVIDSTLVRQQQQKTADSIAKAAALKKKIYITFDDGPNKGTRNVLAAVKEENIAASFFIVGVHIFDSPRQKETWEMLRSDTTVELCNHSYTHAHNRYTSFYEQPGKVVDDFKQAQKIAGFSNSIARMPGRNAWRIDTIDHTDIYESKTAIDSLHQAGFAIMGWDIEWMFDHKTLAVDTATGLLLRRIDNMLAAGKTKTPGHLVLLAHDQAFQKTEDIEKLHYVIQQLKNNPDYELLFASKYPGVKH
ncbi:MAG TPA: polysaccharide deacetylase family protein [Chitinophagaceae bacterium]|nr:polysaccharide deacetylase family protein [Chitinophagaceae bacterium]